GDLGRDSHPLRAVAALRACLPVDRPAAAVQQRNGGRLRSRGAASVRRRLMTRILVVDNYDNLVFNLVQYLGQLGVDCEVRRNDEVSPSDGRSYDGVLLSPGPGVPEKAGVCIPLIQGGGGGRPLPGGAS